MYTVYIIKSINYEWYYVGMSENVERRLAEHNANKTRSTKHRSPYRLIYKRQFSDRSKARDFEKFLKVKSNKEKLVREIGG